MTNYTKPAIALLALSAALAMPAAFAQDATAAQQQTPTAATSDQSQAADATAQAQPTQEQTQPTDPAVGAATQPAGQADASGAKQGWDDVDTNKDGNISKDEASANPGLSQVFGQADGNADGSLTKDEYKAFVSKNYGEPATPAK